MQVNRFFVNHTSQYGFSLRALVSSYSPFTTYQTEILQMRTQVKRSLNPEQSNMMCQSERVHEPGWKQSNKAHRVVEGEKVAVKRADIKPQLLLTAHKKSCFHAAHCAGTHLWSGKSQCGMSQTKSAWTNPQVQKPANESVGWHTSVV